MLLLLPLVLLAFVVVMWLVLLILRCDCCVVAVAVSLMGATAKGQKDLKSEFKQKMFVMIVGCVCVWGLLFWATHQHWLIADKIARTSSRLKLVELRGEGVKGEWVVCLYLKMSTSHSDVTNAKNS